MSASDDSRTRAHGSTLDSIFLHSGHDSPSGQQRLDHGDGFAVEECEARHGGLYSYCRMKVYTLGPYSSLEDVVALVNEDQAPLRMLDARMPHPEVESVVVHA
jgi:hypothetical protein